MLLPPQVDADLAALEPRLAQMEAAEAAAPKAPLRLVGALEERMEGLAAQQVGRCVWPGLGAYGCA
jgi:hypothetical protein